MKRLAFDIADGFMIVLFSPLALAFAVLAFVVDTIRIDAAQGLRTAGILLTEYVFGLETEA